MRKIALALLLGTLALFPGIAFAQQADLEQAIESAKTSADHEAIAKQFRRCSDGGELPREDGKRV